MFPKQTIEERRHLGSVFHEPYVPLRSELSENVSAWEYRKCTVIKNIPPRMLKSVERKFWKTWNKMVLPGIYIILMTVEKTKTRGEHICQIR